jgi:hypothetical protein
VGHTWARSGVCPIVAPRAGLLPLAAETTGM